MDNEGNADRNQGDTGQNTNHGTAIGRALATSDSNQPKGAEQHNESGQEEKKWGHTPDTWMVVLTALIAILGIGTAWIFYRQFQEMSNQTSILRDQAKQAALDSTEAAKTVERQLSIAQQQADAAKKSVAAITKQMRQDQRGWLTITGTDITLDDKTPISVSAPLTLTNTGKTPVKDVHLEGVIEIVKNGDSPSFIYKHVARSIASIGTVLPNKPEPIPLKLLKVKTGKAEPRFLSSAEYQELNEGNGYIVIYARVRYVDIFGVHHWTRYCRFGTPATTPVARTAKKCSNYNNVDNN